VIRVLESFGFAHVSQSGSHAKFRHVDGRTTLVPIHGRHDIGPGLLRAIIREAGVDRDEFIQRF